MRLHWAHGWQYIAEVETITQNGTNGDVGRAGGIGVGSGVTGVGRVGVQGAGFEEIAEVDVAKEKQ